VELKNNDLAYERKVQVYAGVGDSTDKKGSAGIKFEKSWKNKTDDNTFGTPDILREVNQFYKMNVNDLFSHQCAFVTNGTLEVTLIMSAVQNSRTTLSKPLMKRIATKCEQLVHYRQAEQEEESDRFKTWNVQNIEVLEEEKMILERDRSAEFEARKQIQHEYNELEALLKKTQEDIRPREEDKEEQARKRIKTEENQNPALDQILLRNTNK
jgi:hypothetical protein